MAAPVHRFAPVDCGPRRSRPIRHYGPPPMPAVHSSRRQNDDNSLYVEIPPEPPRPTIASLAAARSVTPDTLLRTAALGLHHSPVIAPHLKFGFLVSLALTTLLLAGAKLYFDNQYLRSGGQLHDDGRGIVGLCVAVAGLCCMCCAYAVCQARPGPPPRTPERVSSTARRPLPRTPTRAAAREVTISEPTEDISLTVLSSRPERDPAAPPPSAAPGGSESPPPYHIAVLLPTRGTSPPPPAYSALS